MNIESRRDGRTLHALITAPQNAVIATTSDDHAKRLRYLAHKLERDDVTVEVANG